MDMETFEIFKSLVKNLKNYILSNFDQKIGAYSISEFPELFWQNTSIASFLPLQATKHPEFLNGIKTILILL